VSVHGDHLVLANFESLFVIDPSWRIVEEFSHPWTGAVHDVLAEEDGIWIACTNADLLLQLGWDGSPRKWWTWRDDRALVSRLGMRAVPRFDPSVDYRDPVAMHAGVYNTVHLNAVTRGRDGLLVSLGRIEPPARVARRRAAAVLGRGARRLGVERADLPRGAQRAPRPADGPVKPREGSAFAIVAVSDGDPMSARLLVHEHGTRVPNHNVVEVGGLVVYNDSNRGCLSAARPGSEHAHRAVEVPGSPPFARGLASLGGDRYLVGSQAPAAVHVVDLGIGSVVSSLDLGGEPSESVYAIAALPDAFEQPAPGRLPGWGPRP